MNSRFRFQRLKICVIASSYPRHHEDYAVPWLRESLARLTGRGHEVTVLAPSYEGLQDHTIDECRVVRFRYSPKCWERLTHEQGAPNRIRNPLYQLLAIPYVTMGCIRALRLATRERFDIVHVHWPFPHEPIGSIAAWASGAPLLLNCHGAEFALARRKPWVANLLRRSLMSGSKVIANSSDTARRIEALAGRTAMVLPYGSTVQPKTHAVTRNQVPRILFTGRLIQRKGVEYLLRAAKLVLAQRPVQVVITGDGDQRDGLEKLRDELQLGDAVQFLGFVDLDRLNQEYAKCDIWVNPSIVDDRGDTEGLGVGAIDAYSHGKPVIASRVGGIPDAVIHNETGLLVPEKNPSALASAILDLVNDPNRAKQLAEGGMRFAQRQFCWDRITDQLIDTYRECIRAASTENKTAAPLPSALRRIRAAYESLPKLRRTRGHG